jgi:hypothetical protein
MINILCTLPIGILLQNGIPESAVKGGGAVTAVQTAFWTAAQSNPVIAALVADGANQVAREDWHEALRRPAIMYLVSRGILSEQVLVNA